MLLSEITWLKAEEYFRESDIVIIPVGSIGNSQLVAQCMGNK
ncbi:MAG TPA: hypothetical protein PKG52_11155 [bacterium]|nr:hypothetical protein [bacterium]HPS30885.1 hypothetical protein [bacterium]